MDINLHWERSFLSGRFERELTEAITTFVKPGQTVYDVGAHIGYFTLIFAGIVGPTGRVIAFEPSPLIFKRLQSNLQANNGRAIGRIQLMELALYDRVGEKEFFLGGSTATGRLVRFPQKIPGEMLVSVRATTIDHLIEEGVPFPDILKIDTEYTEDRVLSGGSRVMEKGKTSVFCEVHSRDTGIPCFEFLKSYGYKILHLGTMRMWKTSEDVSPGRIMALPPFLRFPRGLEP